jgi:hypothetical protein
MRLNPLFFLLRMNWSSGRMRAFDLAIALLSLGYGLWSGSQLLIWVGVGAVILSLINPMGRIQRGLASFRKPAGRG